ncbi:hypothetical protein TrLO_g8904 [Triparma laevis f. longispina]|uniref:Uncharacterized protein n=1 Tax=Triparma laevis f. longispina TaxID=1714387 RepID=A0A9W7F4N7_9STRA|nr:hypothetical protein TrLO_g8904 [Triparma laevis f. longispina]
MYGGDQYIKSAAVSRKGGKVENPQSEGIQRSIERWGNDMNLCKKKYKPFEIKSTDRSDGKKYVEVTRMYGCAYHSPLRRNLIKRHGLRKGWYDFGLWSREKAYVRAKEFVGKERKGGIPNSEGMERFVCKGGMCVMRKGERDDVKGEIDSDDEFVKQNPKAGEESEDSDEESEEEESEEEESEEESSDDEPPPPPKKSHKKKVPEKKSHKKKIPEPVKKSHKKKVPEKKSHKKKMPEPVKKSHKKKIPASSLWPVKKPHKRKK